MWRGLGPDLGSIPPVIAAIAAAAAQAPPTPVLLAIELAAVHLTSASKVLIQGITEPLGQTYAPLMRSYGTRVVAGVSPGWGQTEVAGIPVFDLVEQAIAAAGEVDVAVVFVPPYEVLDAVLEAIAAGIRQILITTGGVPPMDMVQLVRVAEATETLIVGPNCPGIIVPGELLLGMHPAEFYSPGPVGLISRSSTLSYEVANHLTRAGLGQSIVASIGADRVLGSSLQQWLQILDEDERTEVIVLLGEVSGNNEFAAAPHIATAIDKPVIAYIAGRYAPIDRTMGHANAIIAARLAIAGRGQGDVTEKLAALKEAKVKIAETPSQIPTLVKRALTQRRRAAARPTPADPAP